MTVGTFSITSVKGDMASTQKFLEPTKSQSWKARKGRKLVQTGLEQMKQQQQQHNRTLYVSNKQTEACSHWWTSASCPQLATHRSKVLFVCLSPWSPGLLSEHGSLPGVMALPPELPSAGCGRKFISLTNHGTFCQGNMTSYCMGDSPNIADLVSWPLTLVLLMGVAMNATITCSMASWLSNAPAIVSAGNRKIFFKCLFPCSQFNVAKIPLWNKWRRH